MKTQIFPGQKVHGHAPYGKPSGTYKSWAGIIRRCNDKSDPLYGGKGITVCERWRDFRNFLDDMGERPIGKSIGRIDGNKGYFPENCRWETWKQQTRNTSQNRKITFNGKTQCLCEWEEELGFPKLTLTRRLFNGWSEEEALTKPEGWRHPVGPLYAINGKAQGLYDWAKEYSIHPATLKQRLDKGWSMEKALTEPLDLSRRRNAKHTCPPSLKSRLATLTLHSKTYATALNSN